MTHAPEPPEPSASTLTPSIARRSRWTGVIAPTDDTRLVVVTHFGTHGGYVADGDLIYWATTHCRRPLAPGQRVTLSRHADLDRNRVDVEPIVQTTMAMEQRDVDQ